MTKEDFLAAYNIGHRDGKEDVYCPNDYDDIFNIEQQSCENCCNGNQEEKAKLCQKSYIAGMEHNCEDEQIIRIKKGTLKARTGKYVVYDVEWLKKHFDTTEAKIYGQSKAEGARGDIPLQQSVPKMPQPSERTEERTEMHECDCISRKLMHDMGATCIAARNENGDLVAIGALDILPSATPQPKTGQQKTGHWIEHKHGGIEHIECSKCRCWFLRKDLIRNSYCPNCGSYNGGTK